MPKPTPPTKTSPPKLSDVARHVVAPAGMTSTGWPAVEKKARDLGISFRWWQKPIGQLILAKRADGTYASTIGGTGLAIPRQVGKTFLVAAIVFALCMLRPGLTVIWTAHRVRTAEQTFEKMKAFARRKRIAPHVRKIVLGSGEEAIEFHNGSSIYFGARATGFGRGFDEIDVLIFDEAQILTEAALDDMVPATNQSRQETSALLLFMGTPPKPTDPGEVFTRMRQEALSGEDDDTGWVEFGADEDYEPTPPPAELTEADWAQVAKGNPSFPHDTPKVAVLRMRKKLGPESFRREGMGIWDSPEKPRQDKIDPRKWANQALDEPASGAPSYYSLAMSGEGVAAIAVAVPMGDGRFVDLAELDRVDDTRALVAWLVKRCAASRTPVAIDTRDPAGALVNELRAKNVPVNTFGVSDCGKAAVALANGVKERTVWHIDQPAIRAALTGTQVQKVGRDAKAGVWEWAPDPTAETAALRAITNAHYGSTFAAKPTSTKVRRLNPTR